MNAAAAATATANINSATNSATNSTATTQTVIAASIDEHPQHLHKKRRCLEPNTFMAKELNNSPTSAITFYEYHHTNVTSNNIDTRSLTISSCSKTIADIDDVSDVFLHIMGFFVGCGSARNTGTIDAKTILSMMQVSKRWNQEATSQKFWKLVPNLKSINMNSNKHNHTNNRDHYDSLDTRLVQYAKIERSLLSEDCWKVRDRATDTILKLEINVIGAQEHCHPQRHLKEVALRERMDCMDKDEKKHLNLVKEWDVCDGCALHWHEYPDDTLESWMEKEDLKNRPQVIKSVVWQLLLGLKSLHQSGVAHGALTTEHVHIFHDRDCDRDSLPLVKVAGFEFSNDHHILDADEATDSVDSAPISELADMAAVGDAFLAMLQGNSSPEPTGIGSVSDPHHYDTIIGSDGIDLLFRLLHPSSEKLCITDAIQHCYFRNNEQHVLPVIPTHSTRHLQQLKLLHQVERGVDVLGIHDVVTFDPYQAAAMVDWLFEIATVFHLSTRTVFVAVGYYNMCCQRSVVNTILDTNEAGSKNFQLLAATSLYIASKCEDCHHVLVGNLSFSADRTFNEADIIATERRVLDAIDWKLYLPTIYDFVRSYMNSIEVERGSQLFWVTLYISELALATPIHVEFKPSMIAACVLLLSRFTCKSQNIWPQYLETCVGYQWKDLSQCLLKLSSMLGRRHSFDEISIIDKRYKKMSRMNVANTAPIRIFDSLEHLQAIYSLYNS